RSWRLTTIVATTNLWDAPSAPCTPSRAPGPCSALTSWPRSVTTWKTPSTKFAMDDSRSRPSSLTLSLAALDQIKAMLDEAAGGAGASVAASAEILAKLRQLTGKPETHAAAAAPSPPSEPPAAASGITRDWQIRFCPGADLMRTGTNPLLLLRE